MSYTELTVWTRGIIMDKEGRDIVNSVAAAGRLEGKFAQAMENYVDNPDRTNAPTRKYCRVSESVLENELTYENEQPNIVVLAEQTMVKGWDYMREMPPGGTLVINTHYTPEYLIRFMPGSERLAQLVCLDAAHIAHYKWLYYRLGELGLDRLDGRTRSGGRSRQAGRHGRTRVRIWPVFHAHLLGRRYAAVGTRPPVAPGGDRGLRTPDRGRHRRSRGSFTTCVPAGPRRFDRPLMIHSPHIFRATGPYTHSMSGFIAAKGS
jgi:hypothetical protein